VGLVTRLTRVAGDTWVDPARVVAVQEVGPGECLVWLHRRLAPRIVYTDAQTVVDLVRVGTDDDDDQDFTDDGDDGGPPPF
jgi:hypothetical protein